MTFEPSDESSQRLCSAVPIVNDMIALEPDEQFSVTLATATPVGRFDNNETCITIIDDDGKYMHINYIVYQQRHSSQLQLSFSFSNSTRVQSPSLEHCCS